jgi:hypothetical protein
LSSSIVSSRLTTGWFVTFFDLCGKERNRWLPRLSLRTRLWARRPVPFGTILTPWPCVDDPVVTVGTPWYSRYCGHSGYVLPPAPEVQRVERFGDVCRRRRAVAEHGRARVPAERVLSQPMRPSSVQQTASHRPQNATVTVAACERIGAVRRRGRCPRHALVVALHSALPLPCAATESRAHAVGPRCLLCARFARFRDATSPRVAAAS